MKAYLATVLAIGALLSYVQASNSPHCFVAVPNVVQAGVEQKVSVSVFNVNNVPMIVRVEQGGMMHNAGQQIVSHGSPRDFTILIPLQAAYSDPPTVVIRVISQNPGVLNCDRSIQVVLSTKIDSVFVQTDKPVYIRNDIVHARFVGVRYDLLPLDFPREVSVDIKNPQDVIVDRFFLNITSTPGQNAALIKKDIALGPSPVVGIWKIIAKHGLNNKVTSEYEFEVKDYVLPRFGVSIIPPSSVAITDDHINFGVEAKYTYGKGVTGKAHIRLGVWNEESNKADVFTSVFSDLLPNDKGTKEFTFPNQFQERVAFPNGKRLFIHVEVIEKASGVNESASDRSAFFTYTPIVLDCELTPPFYKPNLPFLLTVRARYRNGNPASAHVELDGKHSAQTDSEDGTATFSVDIGDVSAEQKFALNVRGQEIFKRCTFKKFESPSCHGSAGSIAVRLRQMGEVKIGTPVDFEVVKRNNVAKRIPLTVIITSCGVIRKTVHFTSEQGPITSCPITFDEDTCSKATVFVYYINACNQVVAAITTVDVEQRCPNDVRLEVDNSQTHAPGSRTDLVINAAVNSEISLLTVDRGLYLLNSKNKLTKEQVFTDLLNYDKSCGYTSRDTSGLFAAAGLTASTSAVLSLASRKSEECPARLRREIRSYRETDCLGKICALGKEIPAGRSHPDDVNRICNEELRKLQTGEERLKFGCLLTDEMLDQLRDCCLSNIKDLISRARTNNVEFAEPEEFEDNNIQVRSFFPHVLSDYFNIGDESRMTKTLTLPDSITEFEIQALAFSSRKGFCVAKPVSIRTFKSVFVECHTPFSFRRQEQGTLKCTAYNYDESKLAFRMQLRNPSPSLCTTAGSGQSTPWTSFDVAAHETKTVLFPFVPLSIGEPNVTITLQTSEDRDDLVQSVRVVPEGILEEYDYSAELDPQGLHVEGGPKCTFKAADKDFRIGTCYRSVRNEIGSDSPICGSPLPKVYTKTGCCDREMSQFAMAWSAPNGQCELCKRRTEHFTCNVGGVPGGLRQENSFYTRLPENYVPGSETAWISCTGKYFEGTMTVIDGISSLLRQPGGCGEQNMIRFGPNVAIAKYLRATGSLVGQKKDEMTELLRRGYQWQLKYRKPSGAFAVWTHHEAATWLSSFVLQTICEAQEFIFIEPDVLIGLGNFLVKERQRDDGSFFEKVNVYHREMVGGVQEGGASMTAFTMLSILQLVSHFKKQCDDSSAVAICKGADYLQRQINDDQIHRPYARAIIYYALLRACSTCRRCNCNQNILARARELLDKKAKINEDGSKYWPADTKLGNAYWYRRRPNAIAVETTAYALCAYVAAGDVSRAGSIAKWLNSVRNSKGAFVSTQDTVVALKCLAEYAVSLKTERSIHVEVSARHDEKFGASFDITKGNLDVNHRAVVPINDIIEVQTTGTGLGLCQLHVQYNIPQALEDQCRFNFTIEAEAFESANVIEQSHITISVCAQYLGENYTSMGMVEVDLPTGYEACLSGHDDCLEELQDRHRDDLNMSLFEVRGSGPVFYFDTIPNDELICFQFRANKEYDVQQLVPVSARVYDYYEPDEKCEKFYTLGDAPAQLSVNCKKTANRDSPACVCGAARCPSIFKEHHNRLCEARCRHSFAYMITVENIVPEGEWNVITFVVDEVLKQDAKKPVVEGSEVNATIARVCDQRKIFEVGKKYHVQGNNRPKMVFDDAALVEKSPSELADECIEKAPKKCKAPEGGYKKPCKEIKNSRKSKACKEYKKCVKKHEEKCQEKVDEGFECYVRKIKEVKKCNIVGVCHQDVCR